MRRRCSGRHGYLLFKAAVRTAVALPLHSGLLTSSFMALNPVRGVVRVVDCVNVMLREFTVFPSARSLS